MVPVPMALEMVAAVDATVWGVVCFVVLAGDEVVATGEAAFNTTDFDFIDAFRSVDAAFNLHTLWLRRKRS